MSNRDAEVAGLLREALARLGESEAKGNGEYNPSLPLFITPADGIKIVVALLQLDPSEEGRVRHQFHRLRDRCRTRRVGGQFTVCADDLIRNAIALRTAGAAGIGPKQQPAQEAAPTPPRMKWRCPCGRLFTDGTVPDVCPQCGRAERTFTATATGRLVA